MNTLMAMVGSLPALLVVTVGLLAMATAAYAKVPRRSTHTKLSTSMRTYWATNTDTEMAIAEFFVVKYCTQAAVSGHYQAAKNLRKQGVPLNVALMILFGERHDRAA